MLRGLPVRVPRANRRNAGAGGSRPPGSYGVRTAGVLVSYDVRTLYAYPPDRGISRGTRGRNTLWIPFASLARAKGANPIRTPYQGSTVTNSYGTSGRFSIAFGKTLASGIYEASPEAQPAPVITEPAQCKHQTSPEKARSSPEITETPSGSCLRTRSGASSPTARLPPNAVLTRP